MADATSTGMILSTKQCFQHAIIFGNTGTRSWEVEANKATYNIIFTINF